MKFSNLALFVIFYITALFAINFPSDKKSEIDIIDVGQGDSILISIKGRKILIDGGENYTTSYFLSKKFPLQNCYLDFVILTHPHFDHFGGLERVMDQCRIGILTFNDIDVSSKAYDIFLQKSKEKNVKKLFYGDDFWIENVLIKILWPVKEKFQQSLDNVNNISVVVFLDAGDFEVLFLGDAEKEALEQISWDEILPLIQGKLDVLKVSHHGSKTGFFGDMKDLFSPEYCVISVGEGNRYSHPHKEALDFYEGWGCQILRTDFLGDIHFNF